jgi:hypothetical protein
MLPHICKADSDGNLTVFSVFLDGKMYPFDKSASFFNEIMAAIQGDDTATVRKFVQVKKSISEFSNGAFQLTENSLFYNGVEIHNALVKRILELFKLKIDVKPMINFLQNLVQNPSQASINELYGFLEVCDLPITDDGHFLAYKMISANYKDLRTGQMDNSVGAVVTMPRPAVDANRNRTCSSGLHFCSLEYIENGGYGCAGRGDRLVVLKINPRDVVSIPTDYNNSKGRACEYLILNELAWTERLTKYYAGFTPTAGEGEDEGEDEDEDDGGCEGESCGECGEFWEDCTGEPAKPAVLPVTTLGEGDVAKIKRDLKSGNYNLTEVARRNGISRRHAGRIRDGEVWGWVKAAK